MNWTPEPATESEQAARLANLPKNTTSPAGPPPPAKPPLVKIGKSFAISRIAGKDVETEVFTMAMGDEKIELLPLLNWGQLDVFKWRVRGKLPGTPAGLEITPDHVKMAGETVSLKDPEGVSKLEHAFHEWLESEKRTLEAARKKPVRQAVAQDTTPTEPEVLRFQVDVDKAGQVHIRCTKGKEVLATIGLNTAGFNSLVSQGLMRKPHGLKVGALHDWVELDGELYSFEHGRNEAAVLEKVLNERYVSASSFGKGKDVVVFANGASPTGFDLQFQVSVGGVPENRRRHLADDSLEILQDPVRCGLLHKNIVLKLAPPHLIIKQKTPDGGERYLPKSDQNMLIVKDEDGDESVIDLSQPINYLKLSTVELTAVFNHPAINKHGTTTTQSTPAAPPLPAPAAKPESLRVDSPIATLPAENNSAVKAATQILPVPSAIKAPPIVGIDENRSAAVEPSHAVRNVAPSAGPMPPVTQAPPLPEEPASLVAGPEPVQAPLPNSYLQEVLSKPPVQHSWLACLVYTKFAETFGNSRLGKLGLSQCWSSAMSEVKDVESPEFKGIFLTEKGGLGYCNDGHIARFNNGVAFLGTQEAALEGIGVQLMAAGLDPACNVLFVVSDGYRTRFGVPDATLRQELERLKQYGVRVFGISEILKSEEPAAVIWTVPLEQENPSDPQAVESRPEALPENEETNRAANPD